MDLPSRLRNRKGQILIETVFVSLTLALTLLLFGQLVKLQKQRLDPYRFSTEKKGTDDSKTSARNTK